jgi:hypothetical protein
MEIGGRYHRDILVFTDETEKDFFLQISAYRSRDIRNLLTTLKQRAPHIKFDADARRFLDG